MQPRWGRGGTRAPWGMTRATRAICFALRRWWFRTREAASGESLPTLSPAIRWGNVAEWSHYRTGPLPDRRLDRRAPGNLKRLLCCHILADLPNASIAEQHVELIRDKGVRGGVVGL